MSAEILALKELIKQLEEKILELEEENALLKHRLGLNSNNSSKPPSSDGLSKEKVDSKESQKEGQRAKSKLKNRARNKEARKSRKGQNNLDQVAEPDHVKDYYPSNCTSCDKDLSEVPSSKYKKHQVFDLPKQEFEVTEHRSHCKNCPGCNKNSYGEMPSYAKAHTQYGPNFGAFCIYLHSMQMIPYNRISEMSHQLFGRKISEQIIINYIKRFDDICQLHMPYIEGKIRAGEVKHADETGIRVNGELYWLLTTSSGSWTQYSVSKKRGDVMKDLTGILSRDCFAPYDTHNPEASMALCNAHLLRDLEAVKGIKGHEWAGMLQNRLLRMNDIKNLAEYLGKEISKKTKEIASNIYNKIILDAYKRFCNESTDPPKKISKLEAKAIALIKRLVARKDDYLRFFYNKNAPFTNNAAENNLRMNKVKQKVSGCFRKVDFSQIFARIRSIIVTLRKQDADLISSISDAIIAGKITFIEN